jgi:hypothetical protein
MAPMVSTASFCGPTNKRRHAIIWSNPTCGADVTTPAGPLETTAKQIAGTINLAR